MRLKKIRKRRSRRMVRKAEKILVGMTVKVNRLNSQIRMKILAVDSNQMIMNM